MPIVSSYEQMAMEKGIEKGIEKGREEGMILNLRANIISILEKRFGSVSPELVETINSREDTAQLQNLLLETVTVNSLKEFQELASSGCVAMETRRQ